MDAFEIKGGIKLKGEIVPQGAKNESLQVICATLLTDQPVVIRNIPNIRDVNVLIKLLEEMGVSVGKINEHTYEFQAKNINIDFLHTVQFSIAAARLRGSIMIIGPLLARYKKAFLPRPVVIK